MIAAAWMVGPAVNLARFVPTTKVTAEGLCIFNQIWPNPFWPTFTAIIICAVYLFIPLLLTLSLYLSIFVHLKRRASTWGSQDQSETMNKATTNVLKTLVLLTACFFLCWVWNITNFFLYNIGIRVSFTSPFYNFTVFMLNISCCVNPFCYAVQYREFQNQVKRLFCLKRTGEEETSVNSVSSQQTTTT